MAIDPKMPEMLEPEAPAADEQPQASEASLPPEPRGAPQRPGAPESQGAPEPAGAPESQGAPEPAGAPESQGASGPAGAPESQGAPGPAGAPESQGAPEPAVKAHLDAPPEPEDHERKLELDLNELVAKAEKADAYLELARRTKADFENYRKRAVREAAAAQERGAVKLAMELLPAVDNLDRALQAAEGDDDPGGDDTLVSGIKLVHADLIAALSRVGIEPFSPEGEQFDPQYHEAVVQTPVEGAQLGTIIEVYQRGYRIGDSVLRPARVVVAG